MKKLYALKVTKSTPNGETLRKVFERLRASYPMEESFPGTSILNNVTAILSVREGYKIGIETQGGNHSRLAESLQKFKEKDCSLIFCSCLKSGATVDLVKKMEPDYEVRFVEDISPDALVREAVN